MKTVATRSAPVIRSGVECIFTDFLAMLNIFFCIDLIKLSERSNLASFNMLNVTKYRIKQDNFIFTHFFKTSC